jgi:hypothetical protein
MYSFAESVIKFFSPVEWSDADDRLVLNPDLEAVCQNRVSREVKALCLMTACALVYEFAPEFTASAQYLTLALKAVSGVGVVAGVAAIAATFAAKRNL